MSIDEPINIPSPNLLPPVPTRAELVALFGEERKISCETIRRQYNLPYPAALEMMAELQTCGILGTLEAGSHLIPPPKTPPQLSLR